MVFATKRDKNRGIWGNIWAEVCTFRSPRYVHVEKGEVATIFWFFAMGIAVFVLCSIFLDYTYLIKQTPVPIVSGWGVAGTMYAPYASEPSYCSSPYTDDYYYGEFWKYYNVGCARYPMSEVRVHCPGFSSRMLALHFLSVSSVFFLPECCGAPGDAEADTSVPMVHYGYV